MSDQTTPLNKRIMIWVGAVTAILSLGFGLQTLYMQLITKVESKNEVESLILSSQIQLDAGDHLQAWKILGKGDQYGVMQEELVTAKIKTAFLWLRNMRANEKVGSWTENTLRILPILSKVAITAEGEYLADIYAHMGWADFLRLRDGNFSLNPEIYYKKALAVDPGNAYANTMLGHWLYWQNKDVERGAKHYQIAIKNGRDLKYTRHVQFSSYKNLSYINVEILKLLNEMKLNGETIDNEIATYVLKLLFLGTGFQRFSEALMSGESIRSSLTPKDELTLFEWLWNEYPNIVKDYQLYRPFIIAILTEASGDNFTAYKIYRDLNSGLPNSNPTSYQLDKYLQQAMVRTDVDK